MEEEKTQIDRANSEVNVDRLVSPKITVNYHDIVTNCNCGKTVVLKPFYGWMVANCECGRNIRMNEDRSRMIIDFNKAQRIG